MNRSSNQMAEAADLPDRAYQRPDGLGFRYGGRDFEGFADRAGLPRHIRAQVARWASALGSISNEQAGLLVDVPVPRVETAREELVTILDNETQLLEDLSFVQALELLEPELQERILRPQVILEREFVWPLGVADAARVLGSVSQNQLRDWDTAEICQPVRWGAGAYRGYFRSHLVIAAEVKRLLDRGVGIDGIREALNPSPELRAVQAVHAALAEVEEPIPA
jgi:MerR-like DNA binding protein